MGAADGVSRFGAFAAIERHELEEAISRYKTILRFVIDESAVAAVRELLAEALDRLRKMEQIEMPTTPSGTSEL